MSLVIECDPMIQETHGAAPPLNTGSPEQGVTPSIETLCTIHSAYSMALNTGNIRYLTVVFA